MISLDAPCLDQMSAMRWESNFAEIERAIEFAKLRRTPTPTLLRRLTAVWRDKCGDAIIARLAESKLLGVEQTQLCTFLESVLSECCTGDHSQKLRAESVVRRLSHALSPGQAKRLVPHCLQSTRRSRRIIAYRLLQRIGLNSRDTVTLLHLALKKDEQAAIGLLARFPQAIPENDVERLLERVREDYWQARVFEWLVSHRADQAIGLARRFPRPYIWGVGRAKITPNMLLLRELLDSNFTDFEFVSLYAWMLGQVGNLIEIRSLHQLTLNYYIKMHTIEE